MSTPTGRQMNWTNVSFTPTTGSAITITGVTSITPDNGGNLVAFSGDQDHSPTTVVNDFVDPSFSITAAGISLMNQLTPGLRGAFTCTFNDAKNKGASGGGGIIYTVADAIVGDNSTSGQHRQFGSATVMIKTESPDGITSPVVVSAA